MPTLDQLHAFVAAAEKGSFSAAARQLGKAQSAVSTAINNLEIEINLELFDRSTRNPRLTEDGQALLRYASTALSSSGEFMAMASSLSEQVESRLCIAVEQSIPLPGLLPILKEFESKFPFIELEMLDPGGSDVATLVRSERVDIGLMMEQEVYPKGFKFKGVGGARLLTVCHQDHPLVAHQPLSHAALRSHRQLVVRSRDLDDDSYKRHLISPKFWLSESPHIVMGILLAGIGWAFLHETVVKEHLAAGQLVALDLEYCDTAIQQGVDIVWTEKRSLGVAGQWMLNQLFGLELK